MLLDFFMHGLRWIVGAFSFACSAALLIAATLVVYAVWDAWELRRERRRILDVDSWMKRSPEPWRGYTLTVLDAQGRELFSSRVEDGYRVNGTVKAQGRAARFALVHAGTVVREGSVRALTPADFDIDGNRLSVPNPDELEFSVVVWDPGVEVRLRLSPEWFKSEPPVGR